MTREGSNLPHKGAAERIMRQPVDTRIITIRGTRAMLDRDLAELFGVPTKVLNQAVRRNRERFPAEFVFQLTSDESRILRSQSVTSNWGGRRYPPYAFTEHGVLMAATVLNSDRAVEMSLFIVRAFVRLRSIYASRMELTRRLDELDTRVSRHDAEIRAIVEAIRQLALPPLPKRRPIGFAPIDGRAAAPS